MIFKMSKISELKEYYKTTALYESVMTIKYVLTNYPFTVKVAVFLIVSIGIFVGPFTYKTLNSDKINTSTNTKTANEEIANSDEFLQYIYVTVSGEVKNPGMYKMTTDDRINDAIIKAGGFTEFAYKENLNLAQRLNDEQYINVMSVNEINAESKETYTETGFYGVVNINTGTIEDLCKLPGIGEITARRIIEYRELTGRYEDIRDIQNVKGIGPEKYDKIKNNITI